MSITCPLVPCMAGGSEEKLGLATNLRFASYARQAKLRSASYARQADSYRLLAERPRLNSPSEFNWAGLLG
jgi:hypothetical protein